MTASEGVGIIAREGLMELIAVLSAMHITYDTKFSEVPEKYRSSPKHCQT